MDDEHASDHEEVCRRRESGPTGSPEPMNRRHSHRFFHLSSIRIHRAQSRQQPAMKGKFFPLVGVGCLWFGTMSIFGIFLIPVALIAFLRVTKKDRLRTALWAVVLTISW